MKTCPGVGHDGSRRPPGTRIRQRFLDRRQRLGMDVRTHSQPHRDAAGRRWRAYPWPSGSSAQPSCPHVVYLHSALAKDRIQAAGCQERQTLLICSKWGCNTGLGIAGLVNLSMLCIAGAKRVRPRRASTGCYRCGRSSLTPDHAAAQTGSRRESHSNRSANSATARSPGQASMPS
jgi:hypothetical protein